MCLTASTTLTALTSVDFRTPLVGVTDAFTSFYLLVFRLKFPFPQIFMWNMPAGHRQWDLQAPFFHTMHKTYTGPYSVLCGYTYQGVFFCR